MDSGDVYLVPLTKGAFAKIDFKNVSLLGNRKFHLADCYPMKYARYITGYKVDGRRVCVYLHRLVMNCPADKQVDHKDGDGLNDMEYNLEVVEPETNLARRRFARKVA